MADTPERYTVESFTAQYGFPPQEYFNREIKSAAAGARIADLETQIAEAQAKLDAIPKNIPADGRKIGGYTAQEAINATADLETEINGAKGTLAGDVERQKIAQDFLNGTIPDGRGAITGLANDLGDLIDTTRIPPEED